MKRVPRGSMRLVAALAVGTVSLLLAPVESIARQTDAMVQPESVEAGFLLIVTDRSGLAGPASPLYMASSRNGWNPGDPAMRLEGRSDMRWQIALPRAPDGTAMEFKFTRGSWDLCEVAADLSDIPNRILPRLDTSSLKPGERPVIELTIEKFSDQRPAGQARRALDPYRPLDVTGTVRRLQVHGGLARSREVLVWVPEGYDDPDRSDRRYPVLYLQDGQNVFERLPSVPGEWHADEAATELVAAKAITPLIIVAIPHAGTERSAEYLPVPAIDGVEARADEYIAFLTAEVMPKVERAFRVRTGPENTAIGGASLGAVISLYAAIRRPDLFGAVLAESTPTLRGGGDAWWSYLERAADWPKRLVIGVGGHESGREPANADLNQAYVEWSRRLDALAASKGIAKGDRLLVIDENAVHNEEAWAARFPAALRFLYPRFEW